MLAATTYDAATTLRNVAARSAFMGAGQTPFLQAALRQGLLGPLQDRASRDALALAQLEEPLVEDQAADLLAWLLHQEGDRRVIQGQEEGLQLLFQSCNSGLGWVRFFRISTPEGHPYRRKVQKSLDRLARNLAANPSEEVYGMMGLPIGPRLGEEAILDHLAGTRWATGHWMAATYVPSKGGFATLGTAHDIFSLPSNGDPVVPMASELFESLGAEEDLDILPARGRAHGYGAYWGGEAFFRGVSHAVGTGARLDIQWTPVSFDQIAAPLRQQQASPFLGVDLGEWTEAPVLGVLIPAPAQRILVCFEEGPDPDHVGIGHLDFPGAHHLETVYGALPAPTGNGRLILPKAKFGELLTGGLPIWNRLLRLGQKL